MQHLMVAGKSLLVGDEVAELLVRYSAVIAAANGGDQVGIRAIDADGHAVEAHLVLDSGTALVSETSVSDIPEPDNELLVRYLHERMSFFLAEPRDGEWPESGLP